MVALLELGSNVITHVPVKQSWTVVKILVLNDKKYNKTNRGKIS